MRKSLRLLSVYICLMVGVVGLLSACDSNSIVFSSTAATATPVPHPLPVPPDNPPPLPSPVALITPTPAPSTPTVTPLPTLTVTPTLAPNLTPTPTVGQIQPPPYCAPSYATPTVTYTPASVKQNVVDGATKYNLPLPLVEAIIAAESGWQPNVIACNGDEGLMQLTPGTAVWVNQFFGLNDDPFKPQDAVEMGDSLIAYYYNYYIGYLQRNYPDVCGSSGCTWDTPWPGAVDNANVRDIIISIYNEGAGTMVKYGILNWWYVQDVLYNYHLTYGGVGN